VDSRPAEGGAAIRRRRECAHCGNRFTTYERRETVAVVRKRDGSLERFSASKVMAGVAAAVADREVPPGALDDLVREIERVAVERMEVSSDDIGRMVLARLRAIDEAAYLRFASVHKGFTGPRDFEREMAALDEDR
jgi:transcriptional repressor NrdR